MYERRVSSKDYTGNRTHLVIPDFFHGEKAMKLERAEIHHIRLPMIKPFVTGCGVIRDRNLLIIKLYAEGLVGIGECSANIDPHYNSETIMTCRLIITDFLLPNLLGKDIRDVEEFVGAMSHVVGNNMAKSALELAFWDLLSRAEEKPLYLLLGGTKTTVEAGVSIGMFDTPEETLEEAEYQLEKGFRRLKVKIKPGHDREFIGFLRKRLGDIPMMADANSSYTLELADRLRALDDFGLTQIEQPLEHDDIFDHARLQKLINTPICLDESIIHARHARQAIEFGSCRIINVKLSRVGGLHEGGKIHDLCVENGIGLWCGSMLESGVGMIYNIVYSSLPGINQPGDIQESRHYMSDDIVDPPIEISPDGTFRVPDTPGLGVKLDEKKMSRYLVSTIVVRP